MNINKKISKIMKLIDRYGIIYTCKKLYYRAEIKYRTGYRYFSPEITQQEAEREKKIRFQYEPLISIVVPVYNTDSDMFREMIESVIFGQTYRNFELVLVDSGSEKNKESDKKAVDTYKKMLGDPDSGKIRYIQLDHNEGISENTNEAIRISNGEYIALMDHDDILHPSALFKTVEMINNEGADFVYSDELSFDRTPKRVQSIHFKPDFSPELLRSNNYICHFTVFSRKLADKTAVRSNTGNKRYLRSEFDGSQDYDLFLRLTEKAGRVSHIADVLYYWRLSDNSVAAGVEAKPYAVDAGLRAVREHMERKGIKGRVTASKKYGPFYRIKYEHENIKKVVCVCEGEYAYSEAGKIAGSTGIGLDIYPVSDFKDMNDLIECTVQYDCAVFLKDGFIRVKRKGIYDFADELAASLEPEENLSAAAPVLGRKYIESYGYAGIKKEFLPEFSCTRINDPGYMNRLRYRMNISFDYGAVLALKPKVLTEAFKEKDYEPAADVFKAESWYKIYKQVLNHGYAVITPYTAFRRTNKVKKANALSVKKDIHDGFYDHRLQKFGKYYLITK